MKTRIDQQTPMFRRLLEEAMANQKAALIDQHHKLVAEVTGKTRPVVPKAEISLKEKAIMVMNEMQDKQKTLVPPAGEVKTQASPMLPKEAASLYLQHRRPSDEEVIAEAQKARNLDLAV